MKRILSVTIITVAPATSALVRTQKQTTIASATLTGRDLAQQCRK